jgi:hypothetical protein
MYCLGSSFVLVKCCFLIISVSYSIILPAYGFSRKIISIEGVSIAQNKAKMTLSFFVLVYGKEKKF